jgi:hypothetical protein
MKQIIVSEYPKTFYFKVKKELPTFDYACKVRGEILLRQLKKQNIDCGIHHPSDFIVEVIEQYDNVEIWHLGS